MKQENNFDDFDKMLFDYYDNKKDIPLSTQNTIINAFNDNTTKKSRNSFVMIKRIAIFIFSLGIISISTVFAINLFNKIFTNSNDGIDTAVENGYVQNVDMDFIMDNDIGIKIDYITMDSVNLDISFICQNYSENFDNIKSISFDDLCIKDEQNNILYASVNYNTSNNIIGNYLNSSNEQILQNNCIKKSMLIMANKFPISHTLYIDIKQVTLKMNDTTVNIDGNWSFSINLDNKLINRTSYEYNCTSNIYIDNIKAVITNTSLSIDIELNTTLDEDIVFNRNSVKLLDNNNNSYRYTQIACGNNIDSTNDYISKISLIYPISYYDNINNLSLHIDFDIDKNININLFK